ncbi:PD-(D/E)XK nuclease family protein [Nocardia stercoris]|uniref:PD-(D/E)XK nuclease family protein n=1 Tax=Nocardia stercoris TaxID=2483361 RepID=A0A3M2L8H8_9NOCA|nr:PD-(D/E)XK nuclease family protein [Nocardia stercoris]
MEWTTQALLRYLEARDAVQSARDDPSDRTEPMPFEWVALTDRATAGPDSRGVIRYERTAWGRRYISHDHRVREIWLPSIRTARADRADTEKAAIADVLARGTACRKPSYGKLYEAVAGYPSRLPERVRIFAFGCGDGTAEPVLDWDQQEIGQRYREYAAPAFARAVSGVGAVPGSDCIGCKALDSCTALPRTPSLWGSQPGDRRPRRSVSAWDLRVYDQCPARYHLTRRLHLGSSQVEHEAATRGRAVDAWLNDQHRQRPSGGCRTIAGPSDPGNWSAGAHHLAGRPAHDGASMLAQHKALCPIDGLAPEERVLVQHQVTGYIPELDVVVIATPDLLYTDSGSWVWRETKTATARLWEGRSLLRSYPQLALAVLLLAAGVPATGPRSPRVEFELLYPGDSTLEQLDPTRADVVDEARRVIAALAGPLLRDDSFHPEPGRDCHDCEARPWCRPGSDYIADNPAPAAVQAAVEIRPEGT